MNEQRVIRVFISSTFRDMKEERDILVKRVFPQLRKICEERQVTWGEVDLRWGVTDEQQAEGKVLPICLEEIKHCRPYFIGLLGERYGWVPEVIPQDLIDREPWLKEHLGHSVTELEILHGVLSNPDMAEHAFFYFRDPGYVNTLPDRKDFVSEDDKARQKLIALKEKIRHGGFPVRENYPGPKALESLVLEDFKALIDRQYPPDEKIEPLDRDAIEHDAYAQSRAQVYIGREEYYKRLEAHVRSKDQPLVILGESGSGKSALLANWAISYGEAHPDAFLLMHFIGATPYSADWAAMIRRIMAELKRRFDIQQEIPDKPDELRSAFANLLQMASAKGKAIIIIDALNQLEDREGALDLVWLPPFIPENIRVILSTLPGKPLEDLKNRQWPTLTVHPLTQRERRVLIPFYLKQYTKTLSEPRVEKIASSPQAANPLYLKVLLEELRLFGEHERLDDMIRHYLEAKDPHELYGKVLRRWEKDYGEGMGLVTQSFFLIWAARRGLTETELLDLLGKDGSPLPRAKWSPLFHAARESLISRSGLLTFAHNFLRDAVCDTYMPTEETRHNAHLRLSDYFSRFDINPRMVDELPWQLSQAQAWQGLKDLLTQPRFFVVGFHSSRFDIMAYWAKLEDNSFRKVDAYGPLIDDPEKEDCCFVFFISILLHSSGHPAEALRLTSALAEKYRKSGDIDLYQCSLLVQADILKARGELDEAMKLHKEQERICRELGDKDGLQASLGNQAVILIVRGELDEAMRLHKEQERICRELGNKDGLQTSLGNQAVILRTRGELDAAMKLYKEQERICRELGNKDGLQISLGNQASIHDERGELDAAMKLYKEQERICRELGNKEALQVFLGNQASTLRDCGELDAAMKLYKEQGRICRELGNKDGLQASLGNQAVIHHDHGELDAAMKLYKEQERICRELGNKDGLQFFLDYQASILQERGEFDEAMRLLKEKERICRELGKKDGLSISLGNQAAIHYARGEFDEAMRLLKEKERICRELGKMDNLAITLIKQAILFSREMNRHQQALPLAEESYRIVMEYGFKELEEQVGNILRDIAKSCG